MSTTMDRRQSPVAVTLPDDKREIVRQQLQPTLVALLDLALVGKQLHWTVTGPSFRQLHLQLDELIDQYRMWADTIAERMSMLGIAPDGRPQRVAGDSAFDPAPDGWTSGDDVIALMTARLQHVATAIRDRIAALEGVDLPSQDHLSQILAGLEEQLWMVSVQRP